MGLCRAVVEGEGRRMGGHCPGQTMWRTLSLAEPSGDPRDGQQLPQDCQADVLPGHCVLAAACNWSIRSQLPADGDKRQQQLGRLEVRTGDSKATGK